MESKRKHRETLKNNGNCLRHKPKFLVEIEKQVKEKIRLIKENDSQLLENRQDHIDNTLEVYREAFGSLLNNIATFKPLLNKIKDIYESALTIRDQRIYLNRTLIRVIGGSNKNDKNEIIIHNLQQENISLKSMLTAAEEKIEGLKYQFDKLERDSFSDHLALSAERDARYTLFFENLKLQSELHEKKLNDEENPKCTKDPFILNLALEQTRKDLSKAINELNVMSEDYVDAIPKKEYELLESDHIVIMRDFNEVTKELKILTENYTNLLKEHESLKEEAVELKDKCTDLELEGTPRPRWEICADFIGGGTARWKKLTKGLSSRENLHVILRELGPTAQTLNVEYFDGLGMDPVIPAYLRYGGQVRNLRLTRRELSILINDIWNAKLSCEKEICMQDFLLHYFSERYHQASVRAEWAYNLCNGCEQMLDDHQIKLFWGVLNGSLSQDIYFAHKAEWNKLKDNLINNFTPCLQNAISMEEFEKVLKMTFPLKSEVDIRNIWEISRRQLKIKLTATEVDIDKLFSENDEGFDRTDLAKELFRQRQVGQEKYIREIIIHLGGKSNPNKLISVENLKRAFVVVDPHIDHIIMESNIRWVFSDKTSNLNMIYPITLKVLASKLSSGNIERVGPRYKRKGHKLYHKQGTSI